MKRVKKFIRSLGPGFITGAADDDPAGIATYAQTGAMFGFTQAWTALFTFPFMTAVQEMCGRIGLVTGKGLAGVIRKYYTKAVVYPVVILLLIANIINIGANLGAMASVASLLIPLPFLIWLGIVIVVSLYLQIFISYRIYAKYLKYLTFTLIAYILTALIIHIDWQKVTIATLIPQVTFNKAYVMNIVAILGTTISPYLFFWQASEEVEEEVSEHKLQQMGIGKPVVTKTDIRRLELDTFIGMFFSNLVMWFIIITAGATLFPQGITNIQTATQAASALRPLAGDFAYILFSIGIIGTGLLAVPVLAGSASYAVAEVFGWKEGLYHRPKTAPEFYSIIAGATGIGIFINLVGINPFTALYYSAVINGIIAPVLLIVILLIANNKTIMGNRTNTWASNILGILVTVCMSIAALSFLYLFFI